MPERQLDLFSAPAAPVEPPATRACECTRTAAEAAVWDDAALIAALPDASLVDSGPLAAEAARRRLVAAVPALAALCRRFAGFGANRVVPEQVAALEALAMIGGRDATDAVGRMIEGAMVRGPTLTVAVTAAARLRAKLSSDVLRSLLRHDYPGVRAGACRIARPLPDLIAVLIDLLDDLDRTVAKSAACALGRMGRTEARPRLMNLLRSDPSRDVIEAIAAIADEECLILLGRIARSQAEFTAAVRDAIEACDHPRAAAIAAAIAGLPSPP